MKPVLAAIAALIMLPLWALAEEPAQKGWVATGLSEATLELFTPDSGAFFAVTNSALLRSNDGGATWTSVPLPPQKGGTFRPRVTVSPADHTRLMSMGQEGLYRSNDDAASWTLVLPTAEESRGVAVSPADPQVAYIGLVQAGTMTPPYRFLRTRDGGDTWEELEKAPGASCGWGMPILRAHHTDPGRVFRAADCYAGRTLSVGVSQLTQFDTTWEPFYETRAQESFFSEKLAGGKGVQPGRYYVAGRRDTRAGGGNFVVRTDDDGATWTIAHERNEQVVGPARAPEIRAIVSDPAQPDRVYLGVVTVASVNEQRIPTYSGSVLVSLDAAISFQPLSSEDLGEIHDLALGVDGQNLYAASSTGVWRFALGTP